MKRFFTLFSLLLFCVVCSYAYHFKYNGLCYNFIENNNYVEVTYPGQYFTSSEKYSGDIVIPSRATYGGYTYSVKRVGEYAFYESNVTSVTVNSMEIGNHAFEYCKRLKTVVISENTINIGTGAFEGCSNLSSLTMKPNDAANMLKTLGKWAFNGCVKLTANPLAEGIGKVEDNAFEGCIGLTTVVFPKTLTYMGNRVFKDCKNLKTVKSNCKARTYYDGQNIGKYCYTDCEDLFDGCANLTSPLVLNNEVLAYVSKNYDGEFVIGDTISELCNGIFKDCKTLTRVVFPESIYISKNTCKGCDLLEEVILPSMLMFLNGNNFENCTNLRNIQLPQYTCFIGNNVFKGCSSINSINFPQDLQEIGAGAFAGCSSLRNVIIPDNITELGDACFSDCTNLKRVYVGNGISAINYGTFLGCSSLEKVLFPVTLNTVEEGVFEGCAKLSEVVSLARVAPTAPSDLFKSVNKMTCKLSVLSGFENVYGVATGWKDLLFITAFDLSRINEFLEDETSIQNVHGVRYGNDVLHDLNGIQRSKDMLSPGIYIQNGKKVLVK